MHIAILTFDGFNELDSLIAFNLLNRVERADWRVSIASPERQVRSMNGLLVEAQVSLEDACQADAVLVGSGIKTRDIVATPELMSRLRFDPKRQLLGAQCSGTLILAKLGLLDGVPACTDLVTKPWVEDAGIDVINEPFTAKGNVATSGGCLSSQYLATWFIARLADVETAKGVMFYVAPVGEKETYVSRALENISPFL
ncbi:DJ-1/PfpI family protein [Pseudomonas nitroreducens]|uniref:DJ-1/PfpI family protein n=1 Tax=Pseudomonas TaxID=286 RepID=UPI000806B5CB|nr:MULTISPECIES: DJ-1/PfpI family protein [Pseudomonas]MDG9856824.1 DJ-1/PfpI family protein [Pseudomonas nitroreducens]MDH1072895.1 DJ-1/PfpI family protein [Pseudomonas nitroreducens]NMZ72222.1 AraC family transcriptional regulator [Pseudomonas nitroreducens]OBY57160.1 AraC family transcriptional regulator [Pseudomonas sp. AU12215]